MGRTSWLCLCGAAVLATAAFVTCGGPTPIPGSSSSGINGGAGQGGTNNPIDLTKATSTKASTSTGTGSSTDICNVTTNSLTKQPADLLLILDRSGSMTSAMDSGDQCAAGDPDAGATCQQRWATMIGGLTSVFNGAATTSGDVTWGLKLYSSDGACGVTAAMDVPIAPGSAATIQSTIAGITPNGNTPTQEALKAGVAYLQTLTDTNGKYILLATDGEPNCATGGGKGGRGGNGASDVPGTGTEILAAVAAGFKVYVIGVGPQTTNLNDFAVKGGTGQYYPALSPQDLDTALSAIVGAVASCTFNLGKAPPDPSNVAIEFNGDKGLRAPQDTGHTNGWDYTSAGNTVIQLYGSWCDNVTNGTYTSYQILMGCPGQPIP